QKIAQNSEPAIRASLYIDLRRVSDALGVAVIDADHLPIPKPLPVEPAPARPRQHLCIAQLWDTIAELDGLGITTNHSRSVGRIALNLPEVVQLATKHKIPCPHMPTVRRHIETCKEPAFLKMAAVNSVLLNKSVKCYVFQAQEPQLQN
ncbi:hypothetical protein, partial [Undibacterium umbellatum]